MNLVPPSLTIKGDLSNLDEIVATMKALLEAMYRAKFFPKASILWVGPGALC